MKLTTVLFFLLFGFQFFVFCEKNESIAYPDQFPSLKHAKFMGGEITMIDHVNRMGILRPDRSDEHNKYHWDLPHHFEMLPYGIIYRYGAPATIRDIDLGTHMHGIFFLGKQGMYKVPLLETQYFQQIRNQPNEYSPDSPYSQALRLEDDFSFYLRQKATWQITHIDHEEGKLT
ncbi:MAG: hypothetical protein EBW86_12040, partial [Rhodobacteraceae bacterium]|nr:hypothetical protein [Paracoccaceae bacterium]